MSDLDHASDLFGTSSRSGAPFPIKWTHVGATIRRGIGIESDMEPDFRDGNPSSSSRLPVVRDYDCTAPVGFNIGAPGVRNARRRSGDVPVPSVTRVSKM